MSRSVKGRRKTMRGALTLVASLMVLSAVLRIGGDAGRAWAKASDAPEREVALGSECTTEDDLHGMLKSFQAREAQIKQREAAIMDRQQALTVADRQIESKLAQLEAAEEKLRRTLTIADTAAESDIERLTKVYESMKSKEAAALFEEMDPDFAAGFLGRMKPDAAAGILAGLSPQAAHRFSVVLAGRNAGAPKQ
ncbi:MotE family protein [Roseovarius sp. S4756]|uniref:MotE family protein n=1 Tax=Roseovarius maritimus TaxID=3342637 RepID=UPI0037277FF7